MCARRFILASLSVLFLLLPASAAPQGGGIGDLTKALAQVQRSVGPALAVNGEKLDPLEVERQTVYMVGQRLLQEKLINLIIDDQMAQQIAAGEKRETFAVLEDEVKKQIERTIQEFAEKNPGKDFWAELARTNTSREEYETLQRSTLLFDKVFFRGIPTKWPEITKEAIIASGRDQGRQFFDRFAEAVKEGQEVPALWLHICRRWVIDRMQEWCDVRYASDGLPPDVCLAVNGREWKTADAARALALRIKPEDRLRAQVDIVLQTALRQELTKSGAWLSDGEFRRAFDDYCKVYEGSLLGPRVLALSFMGYPTFEVYKARWRLERSFEKMIAKEIDDQALAKHLERAKDFLADGRLSVQIIRIPAFDDASGTWKEAGFEKAREVADSVMDEIEQGKSDWAAAMAKHSKWPEQQKDQGTYHGKSLNELRTELRENAYTDFIHGYSVGEILFFDSKVNAVIGPLRGQDAYYIAKIVDRSPATGSMSIADKNQRDLIKQDYVSHRFLAWANEVAGRAEVR